MLLLTFGVLAMRVLVDRASDCAPSAVERALEVQRKMEWEQMWILIVTAWVAGDPPHARFFPTIFAQEFSSESKCLTAKAFVDEEGRRSSRRAQRPSSGESGGWAVSDIRTYLC